MDDSRLNATLKYVPKGYRLFAMTRNEQAASGFATLGPQVTVSYSASGSGGLAADAIEVHHTSEANQELVAAAGHSRVVKVGRLDAVYHDAVNTAVGVDSAGHTIVEPDHGRHSLTVASARGTYAVRAPSSVPYEELVRMISSLLL
jgi:hypothetical protein